MGCQIPSQNWLRSGWMTAVLVSCFSSFTPRFCVPGGDSPSDTGLYWVNQRWHLVSWNNPCHAFLMSGSSGVKCFALLAPAVYLGQETSLTSTQSHGWVISAVPRPVEHILAALWSNYRKLHLRRPLPGPHQLPQRADSQRNRQGDLGEEAGGQCEHPAKKLITLHLEGRDRGVQRGAAGCQNPNGAAPGALRIRAVHSSL